MKPININGQKFGDLTVLRLSKKDKYGTHWECSCACGGITIVRGSHLRQGKTGSCGCKQGWYGEHPIKHGYAMNQSNNNRAAPEYYTWLAMMARCKNPKTKKYELYGGRGISVCERWLKFENFIKDMGRRPNGRYSLDRFPNKDGNYEPGNCRWATIQQQNQNTNRNVFYEHNGKRRVLEEWARELNADPSNIGKRIKDGQSFSDIYNHFKYHCVRRKRTLILEK